LNGSVKMSSCDWVLKNKGTEHGNLSSWGLNHNIKPRKEKRTRFLEKLAIALYKGSLNGIRVKLCSVSKILQII
jgi:hypothetical protein